MAITQRNAGKFATGVKDELNRRQAACRLFTWGQ